MIEGPPQQHSQGFSDMSSSVDSTSVTSHSSPQSVSDSGISYETKSSECPTVGAAAKQSDSTTMSTRGHSSKVKASTLQTEMSLSALDQKVVSSKIKKMSVFKNRSASDATEHARSHSLSEKPSEVEHSTGSVKNRRQASEDAAAAVKCQVAKFEDVQEGIKHSLGEKTLTMKLSGEADLKSKHATHLKAIKHSNSSNKDETGSDTLVAATLPSPAKENIRQKEHLLLRAAEVRSLLNQVASLMKE